MLKVTITNSNNGREWGAKFHDQASLDTWLAAQRQRPGRRAQREVNAQSESFDIADVVSERTEDGVRYVTLKEEASIQIVVSKEDKLIDVDQTTQKAILNGFTFRGKKFSMSAEAQKNWTDMYVFRDFLLWPVEVSTKDNGSFILERSDLDAFIAEALKVKKDALDSGRALKKQISDANTLEKLNKVKDTRKEN